MACSAEAVGVEGFIVSIGGGHLIQPYEEQRAVSVSNIVYDLTRFNVWRKLVYKGYGIDGVMR